MSLSDENSVPQSNQESILKCKETMSISDENIGPKSTQQCILKCKEASHFFEFPHRDILQGLWLYKLGLEDDEIGPNERVCDRHFSNKMMSFDKTLLELAVPDQNLPEELQPSKVTKSKETKTSVTPTKPDNKPEANINKDTKKMARIKKSPGSTPKAPKSTKPQKPRVRAPKKKSAEAESQTTPSQPLSLNDNFTTKSWIKDSSNLLMDYQLRVQGKPVCDVIEMPEYVVVLTVAIPKNTRLSTLEKERKPTSELEKPLEPIEIKEDTSTAQISSTQGDIPPDTLPQPKEIASAVLPPVQQEPQTEIDYVYYMTDGAKPRRDRAVQVESPPRKKEAAIQCDVKLDHDIMEMAHNAQLYLLERSNTVFNQTIPMHECLDCGEVITNYMTKVKHTLGHQDISSLCAQCGEMFINHMELKAHEKLFHPNLIQKKTLRCPKFRCTKAFYSTKQLNKHIERTHMSRDRGDQCNMCKKCFRPFRSQIQLLCHQKALDNCLRARGIQSKRYTLRSVN